MLRKVISIKNVGTFRNHGARGEELRRLTLVHAENGRGKTTLCAALRSFRGGDPSLIQERKTLGTTEAQQLHLLMATGNVTFNDTAWSATCPQLEIFDAEFITENVYFGDLITHDHKKNLCRVVLGAEGVKLAEKLDELDGEEREAGNTVNSAMSDVQALAPRGMALETFLGLPADKDIDAKITAKQEEIKVAEGASAIQEKRSLSLLNLPTLPPNIEAVLGKTIEGVSVDAERRVKEHIDQHINRDRVRVSPEGWLGTGVAVEDGEVCPMCAQPLDGSALIGTLRDYFSNAYREFQRELDAFKKDVTGPTSAEALIDVQKVVAGNAGLMEFWGRYVKEAPPELSFEGRIKPVVERVRDALAMLVEQKTAAPLDAVPLSQDAVKAMAEMDVLRGEVERYNERVHAYNSEIDAVKKSAETSNLSTLENELERLEAQKTRHLPESLTVVTAYIDAQAAKVAVEAAKEKAREELNAYNEKVIGAYHDRVNEILARIGAGFKLRTVKVEYTGRTPRAAYTFEIRGVEVEPGSDRTAAGTPCFRNTLSAGDRNTLALAFFIAQLKNRADLADLIVVFDDPFTSLDNSRRHWTCCTIRKIAETAKQVIVLSHSLDFLKGVAERCPAADLRTVQIARQNQVDSHIIDLDLNDATASQVEKDVIQLRGFLMGDHNDMPPTIRCIRPVLENHMRKMAPDDVPPGNGWLGTFLGDIQRADANSPLAVFKPMYEDLDNLNSYTSPYAHDSGECPPIVDAELMAHVELTLNLIGRG